MMLAGGSVPSAEAQALGYGIAGPAGFSGFFGSSVSHVHAAGGAEVLTPGGFGIGGEVGVLGGRGSALFVLSANGSFHISTDPSVQRVVPFLTGGYTNMRNSDGSFNAWNVGAGVDIWLRERAGLRVDVRDHVRRDSRGAVQYWAIRAGIVFR